jgi:hypothetical protein
MKLNADVSLKDKRLALRQLPAQFKEGPSDILNRLFFSARNGAIASLLRDFEHYFADQGLSVRAHWEECSMRAPRVSLRLVDKRTGQHDRHIYLVREVEPADNVPSQCVYGVSSIDTGAYYPHRTPKIAEQFDAILASAEFQALAPKLVNGANYPFQYESFSSF